MSDEPALSAIPIILIAGYLGSGKTTFLNHLLTEAKGQKLAILVNDFGAINIDASLIDGAVDGVVALKNGCICCSIASGLQSAIFKVLQREQRPEAIIIESSGVSNPGEILRILSDSAMSDYASLELIVSLLDCERLPEYTENELKLINLQLMYSNIVLLTRFATISNASQNSAEEFVRKINPRVLLFNDSSTKINLELLLGNAGQVLSQSTSAINPGDLPLQIGKAEELFRSWSFQSDTVITESEFQKVLNDLPPETIRGKGQLYLKDYPDTKFIFQMVGKNAKVEPAGKWGTQEPLTKIIFIALRN